MKRTGFSTGSGMLISNPRNLVHAKQQAMDNFHLVRGVMSVKASVNNRPPQRFSHMNSNYARPKPMTHSTQEILKRYESQR